jgi:hypothetical protein
MKQPRLRDCAFYLCRQTFKLAPVGGQNRLYCSELCKRRDYYPEAAERKKARRRAKPKLCSICGSARDLMVQGGHPINKCRPCGGAIIKLTMLKSGRMKLKQKGTPCASSK